MKCCSLVTIISQSLHSKGGRDHRVILLQRTTLSFRLIITLLATVWGRFVWWDNWPFPAALSLFFSWHYSLLYYVWFFFVLALLFLTSNHSTLVFWLSGNTESLLGPMTQTHIKLAPCQGLPVSIYMYCKGIFLFRLHIFLLRVKQNTGFEIERGSYLA